MSFSVFTLKIALYFTICGYFLTNRAIAIIQSQNNIKKS